MNIILLSSYFQSVHATANGLCASSIRDELCKRGHQVTVICYKAPQDNFKEKDIIEIEEKKELIFDGSDIRQRMKAYAHTIKALFEPYSDRKLVDSYKNSVIEVMRNKKVDMIVAFYFPLETAIAVTELKEEYPDTKTVIYELDSVGDGISGESVLEKMKTNAFEQYLDKLYCRLDKIVVMRAHKAFWVNKHSRYLDKMLIADIPMVRVNEKAQNNFTSEEDSFDCIYAGLLDTNYRDPKYFLELLSEINKNEVLLKAHFYSKGNCEETLKKIAKKTNYLETHGYVAKDILDKASEKTSCFISIGNANSNSVPSKIFSYISGGKPIVHISSQKRDVCVDYLNRYPMALVLYQRDSLLENVEKVKCFLNNCRKKTVDIQGVEEIFVENTPEFSAKIIETLLT